MQNFLPHLKGAYHCVYSAYDRNDIRFTGTAPFKTPSKWVSERSFLPTEHVLPMWINYHGVRTPIIVVWKPDPDVKLIKRSLYKRTDLIVEIVQCRLAQEWINYMPGFIYFGDMRGRSLSAAKIVYDEFVEPKVMRYGF